MSKPRIEVSIFAQSMERKLKSNDHKDGWKKCKNSYLLHNLKREIHELEEALIDGNIQEIQEECCDIANFAMMIFDNAKE